MALVDAMSAVLGEGRALRASGPHTDLDQHSWRLMLRTTVTVALIQQDPERARIALLQVLLVAAAAVDQVIDLVPTLEEQP